MDRSSPSPGVPVGGGGGGWRWEETRSSQRIPADLETFRSQLMLATRKLRKIPAPFRHFDSMNGFNVTHWRAPPSAGRGRQRERAPVPALVSTRPPRTRLFRRSLSNILRPNKVNARQSVSRVTTARLAFMSLGSPCLRRSLALLRPG